LFEQQFITARVSDWIEARLCGPNMAEKPKPAAAATSITG